MKFCASLIEKGKGPVIHNWKSRCPTAISIIKEAHVAYIDTRGLNKHAPLSVYERCIWLSAKNKFGFQAQLIDDLSLSSCVIHTLVKFSYFINNNLKR